MAVEPQSGKRSLKFTRQTWGWHAFQDHPGHDHQLLLHNPV